VYIVHFVPHCGLREILSKLDFTKYSVEVYDFFKIKMCYHLTILIFCILTVLLRIFDMAAIIVFFFVEFLIENGRKRPNLL
jgi:hypothetical protein